jgi:hypothetical protein
MLCVLGVCRDGRMPDLIWCRRPRRRQEHKRGGLAGRLRHWLRARWRVDMIDAAVRRRRAVSVGQRARSLEAAVKGAAVAGHAGRRNLTTQKIGTLASE